MPNNIINPDEIKPKPLEVNMPELTIPATLETVDVPDQPGIEIGIDETLDAVDFAISFANAIVLAYEDGTLSLTDFGYAMTPFMKIPAVLSGINAIPAELANLSEEELDTIITKVQEDLEVDNEKAKDIVIKSLSLAYSIYELVKVLQVKGVGPIPDESPDGGMPQ